MSRPKALIVEDSDEFVRLARRILETEGFSVAVATNGERGVALAREETFELMLVDITLPGMDGFDVCREVRSFSDAYVVMVTARDEELEKVVGFRVGADDYVTKPYSPAELSARIGAMRRRPRAAAAESTARVFGDLSVDVDAREAQIGGDSLELTKIEFDLLHLLTSTPKRVFSRHQMLESVWGYSGGDDHVVDVHVANLRRKLGESASHQHWIRTVRGVGYRFDPAPGG